VRAVTAHNVWSHVGGARRGPDGISSLMAILVDPPRWPAHGMLWSHLVSDFSYDELHVFARGVGIPRRGFDLDHYDVPERMYAVVLDAGAVAVESRVLIRRLHVSGLRVRQVDRGDAARRHRKAFLRGEWAELGARLGVPDPFLWRALGEDLLLRWSEPHRHYHDLVHLQDVLLALDQLADLGEVVEPVALLAAWFHDAVYDGSPGVDERRSADLARSELRGVGLSPALAADVARLVRATTPGGSPPDVTAGGGAVVAALAVLRDADLAILAAGEKRYAAYTTAVRREYAHVPDGRFRRGRAAILEGFLAEPWIYHTPTGRARWEERARANLAQEITHLRAEG